jgi:hypothetical protein
VALASVKKCHGGDQTILLSLSAQSVSSNAATAGNYAEELRCLIPGDPLGHGQQYYVLQFHRPLQRCCAQLLHDRILSCLVTPQTRITVVRFNAQSFGMDIGVRLVETKH